MFSLFGDFCDRSDCSCWARGSSGRQRHLARHGLLSAPGFDVLRSGHVLPSGPCCTPCPPPDICTDDVQADLRDVVSDAAVRRLSKRLQDLLSPGPYCVTVPVTKVDCVTVDEGCYKMVWCPSPW